MLGFRKGIKNFHWLWSVSLHCLYFCVLRFVFIYIYIFWFLQFKAIINFFALASIAINRGPTKEFWIRPPLTVCSLSLLSLHLYIHTLTLFIQMASKNQNKAPPSPSHVSFSFTDVNLFWKFSNFGGVFFYLPFGCSMSRISTSLHIFIVD